MQNQLQVVGSSTRINIKLSLSATFLLLRKATFGKVNLLREFDGTLFSVASNLLISFNTAAHLHSIVSSLTNIIRNLQGQLCIKILGILHTGAHSCVDLSQTSHFISLLGQVQSRAASGRFKFL